MRMLFCFERFACCHGVALLLAAATIRLSICSGFTVAPLTVNVKTCVNANIHPWQQRHRTTVASLVPSCRTSKTSDGGDDTSNPNKWNSATAPFVVVRYYARENVDDEEIQHVLNDLLITNMDELKRKFSRVAFQLAEDDATEFSEAVKNACLQLKTTPEIALGGEVVYDETCIAPEAFDMYTPDAVSVKPNKLSFRKGRKKPKFSLVFGSSGSGKTLFALKALPSIVFGNGENTCVCIHFPAARAVGLLASKRDIISFPQAVVAIVQDKITEMIASKPAVDDDIEGVELFLHVVIDEAGPDSYQCYFNTTAKILEIVAAVQEGVKPKFTKGVHVTLTGTGLETATAEIVSAVEANKFRMQPWKPANFDALVAKSDHSQPKMVKDVVHRFQILDDLSSNARCAYFLLTSLEDEVFLGSYRLKSFANIVISTVADSYITSNALVYLESVTEIWLVVRSLFRELDQATSQPGVAFFPKFDDLPTEKLRAIARSLLDLQVESRSSQTVFVSGSGNRYSLSLSPALALVLVHLLNQDNGMTWNWQELETVVALSELKEMIVRSQGIPKDLDRLVVELHDPFPAPCSASSFSVPVVGDCTVILNCPKASSFADVIAPYRLVQTRFSIKDNKAAVLNIQNELNKMGVTYSSKHILQQNVTKILHWLWENGGQTNTQSEVVSSRRVANKERRFTCYPMNTLNPRHHYETPAVVVATVKKDKLYVKGGGISKASELPEEFDEDRPITVVFATNCRAFELENEGFTFKPEDVDCEGKLLVPFPEGVVTDLRTNVEIRLIFF